ncbi:hypothetical protein [Bdellovibrio sp. HCB337]|uniref:hypothetical protein n=1 Tax=Bdellovibrio sp. HCB337 TaxID=3394358 RepID=UPI0039A48140
MKLSKVLLSALALAFVAGCKTVDIKDGRVPTQYLSHAKKLAGTYKGEFNGVPGTLTIAFNGNKPVVTYQNRNGTDILNNNCHSQIGDLLQVTVKNEKKKPEVSNAVFDFEAMGCALLVRGRDISLSFKETDKGLRVSLTLLKDVYQREVCRVIPGNPPHVPPSHQCTWQQDPIYLYGRFVR